MLLAYFSRPGENYYYGDRIDLEIGNTQVVAEMIAAAISVDVYRIEAVDPYPDDYEQTVQRNVHEEARRTRARRSRIHCRMVAATTRCCWAARCGTCRPR